MNRGQLRTEVEAIIGRTDKASVVNKGLSFGLQEVGKRWRWRGLQAEVSLTLLANGLSLTLPTTCHQVVEARVTDGTSSGSWPLELKTKGWVMWRYPSITALTAGMPVYGYVENNVLYVCPKADKAYSVLVTHSTLPVDFAGDTSLNPITTTDLALVAWAAGYTFDSLEMFDSASVWKQNFEVALVNAIRTDRSINPRFQADGEGSTSRTSSTTPWLDPFEKGMVSR